MEDTDLMPFGKFKGTAMANVPPEYLLWLKEKNRVNGKVLQYINDNLDAIILEINRKALNK